MANESKIAELKKEIRKLQRGVDYCHRREAGVFCGFCDSAVCKIDTLKDEINKLRKEDNAKAPSQSNPKR